MPGIHGVLTWCIPDPGDEVIRVAFVLHHRGDSVVTAPKTEVQLLEAVVGHAIHEVKQEKVLQTAKQQSAK